MCRAACICQRCCALAQVLVKVGAIKAVTSILQKVGIQYSIYDGVEPNPTIEQVTPSVCLGAHHAHLIMP